MAPYTSTAEEETQAQMQAYLESQTAMMAEQLEAQAQFNEAQIALQNEQMEAQEAMAELSSVEATKSPNDFVQANPADTKDHPNGVWTLPPVGRHEPADAARYQAIGESDRMTLRFVKPAG